MKMNRLIPMLPVRSMPASVEFYQKLGFSIEHRNDDWGWAMLRFDDCRLMVDQSINRQPGANRQGVLYLYPQNVAEYHAQLRKNGLTIPDPEVTFYGMTEFRFDDPDGNRLWIGSANGSFMISTRQDAEKFAADWADAWNRRDAEAVLAHFHEDIVFTSPTALAVTGSPVIRGKDALRKYWATALARIGSIRFSVVRVLWDSTACELAIVYVAEIDGRTRTVSENLIFGADGRIAAADVFHGVQAPT